jgi:patatin-like phospholipase
MPFRVLSLDGGGAWALIEVRTLMTLYGEDAAGHQVLKNFDLVAANSGGSLVLAGLVENLPLGEILQYLMDENKRRSIFSPTTSLGDSVLRSTLGIGPKYSANAKLPAIERLLPRTGDSPLAGSMNGVVGPSGSPVHLLIVGFDYDRNRAVFFRSAAAARPGWGRVNQPM